MAQEIRVKELYQKYIDHTCSDEELEELFDLLKEKDHLGSVKDILRQNWDSEGRLEELSSLEWGTFKDRRERKDSAYYHCRFSLDTGDGLLVLDAP